MLPDLTVMGKVIGGGLPAAAYGGSVDADGAHRARPATSTRPGTLCGQPARDRRRAGRARAARRRRLRAAAARPPTRWPRACAEAAGDTPVQVCHTTGLLTVFFSETPVTDYASAQACDLDAHARWCRALLARGVYPPPSQFEAWFPSLAHTAEHVARTLEAAEAAFRDARLTGCARRAACSPARRSTGRAAVGRSPSRRSARASAPTTATAARPAHRRRRPRAAGGRPPVRAGPRRPGRARATSTPSRRLAGDHRPVRAGARRGPPAGRRRGLGGNVTVSHTTAIGRLRTPRTAYYSPAAPDGP